MRGASSTAASPSDVVAAWNSRLAELTQYLLARKTIWKECSCHHYWWNLCDWGGIGGTLCCWKLEYLGVTWVRWVLVHPRKRDQGELRILHRRPPSGLGSGPRLSAKGFPPLQKEQVYANVWWGRLFNAQTSWSIFPQPDFLLVNDVKEGRPSWAGVIFWGAGEMLDAANDAGVHSLLPVLVVLVAELPGNKSRLGRKWRCIL